MEPAGKADGGRGGGGLYAVMGFEAVDCMQAVLDEITDEGRLCILLLLWIEQLCWVWAYEIKWS